MKETDSFIFFIHPIILSSWKRAVNVSQKCFQTYTSSYEQKTEKERSSNLFDMNFVSFNMNKNLKT
jgi:hypothetical protein